MVKNQEAENIVENVSNENEVSFAQEAMDTSETDKMPSSDLKEFGVDVDEPDLFNSDNQSLPPEDLLKLSDEDHEEDDLEIPAFLRRQKINGLRENKWKPPWYRIFQSIIRYC